VGTVVTVDGATPVKGGKVIFRTSRRNRSDTYQYQEAKVSSSGTFNARLTIAGTEVIAFYVPASGYGECESATKPLR
jgi:hypothetical protein